MEKAAGSVGHLTGSYLIRTTGPSRHEAHKLWPKAKHWSQVRRHALKLRFFPEQRPADDSGMLLDLDWSWVKAIKNGRVGELRIHDTIGGHDNIRLIFLVGDNAVCRPLPMIWILSAMQKKSMDFSTNSINTFKARKTLVLKRFYG